jgi:hypothetical protein
MLKVKILKDILAEIYISVTEKNKYLLIAFIK